MLKLFAALMMVALGATAPAASAKQYRLEVQVEKVVYAPGATGRAAVKVEGPAGGTDSAVLESRLEYRLTERVSLPEVPVVFREGKAMPLALEFIAPPEAWGVKLHVALYINGQEVASAWDVFAVGTNNYRLGQQSSCQCIDLSKKTAAQFKGRDSYWLTEWRNMKGTWEEIFCGSPCEFCGLKTDWDQWISMQGKYKRSKEAIRAFTDAAHRLGLKVMIYNNATPSGSVGTAWARKHPEWLSYNYMGGMRADLSVEDVEKAKSWHKTMKPHACSVFQPLYLNLYDPKLIEFGCDQMLYACKDLGYDGVRFDGHWIVGPQWSGLGFGIEGRRPNRGESLDALNTRITRHMRSYIRERKPDFLFGYNYGSNYECEGIRSPRAYREACSGGGMILWEGATFGDEYSNWRVGALKLRENALRVHQNGGMHYGQAYMLHAGGRYSSNDFSLRYYYITNFAATSHIYAGAYPEHPSYRPIQGIYYRFALRFGELLFDKRLRPIKNPEDHLSVAVNGRESPDLWWKLYTYKRPLKGKYQIITHLVNMPGKDVKKENSTPDKQPPPIRDVLVTFASKPARVFILDPEGKEWMRQLGSVKSVRIPELKAWKIVVQQFPGSCDRIPVEVIPETFFRGKDVAPDPEDDRIVLPITLFPTGAVGTRLVHDENAMLGCALRCEAGATEKPLRVAFGPMKSMPNVAPGRCRTTLRLKVADNTSAETACTVSGRFGNHAIPANAFRKPGAFQEFAYDYEVKEGKSNYLFVDHHGLTDLTIDSVVMQQLELARDRDFFDEKTLDVSALSPRRGYSKKAHLLRGLWHDYFGLEAALKRARMEWSDSWEILSTDHAIVPAALPAATAELLEYDLVALLNASADSLQPIRRKNLREYVLRGGTLFVGGGPRAFGHGGYKNTFLAEILPVKVGKFDLKKAEGEAQLIRPGGDHEITRGISFAAQPRNLYYHNVQVKPGATVLLAAGATPILSVWKLGRGTVYAMTGTPLGEPENGTPWWLWDGWQAILDRILAQASPGAEPTLEQVQTEACPVLGRLSGTENLTMFDRTGAAIPPLETEGVRVVTKGISFGYGDETHPKGILVYQKGLIKPRGSISFKITPGWETEISSLDRSVPLFWTQSESHDGIFQIYIYVHWTGGFALACGVRTNDVGDKKLTEHLARYAIKYTPTGGLRLLKSSIWKKGQERTVTVEWSPSQIIIRENGQRMAASDFWPEMDLSSFTGPLYVGSDPSRRLSRVILRDIVVRGQDR